MAQILNVALGKSLGSTPRQILDGVEFRVSVFWREEAVRVPFQFSNVPPPLVFGDPGVWVLGLAQSDGTRLFEGQILRHGVNVLAPWGGNAIYPGAGLGQLLAWDASGNDEDPGRDDLVPGSTKRLIYRSAAELG